MTVTKLSADAAVICWKFPLAARVRGYVLRYWRHPSPLLEQQQSPLDADDSPEMDGPVLELKIIDMDGGGGAISHDVRSSLSSISCGRVVQDV